MARFLLRQLLTTILIALVATFVVHTLFFLAPQDRSASGDGCYTLAEAGRVGTELGPAQSVWLLFRTYGAWLGCVARGDLAMSLYKNEPVTHVIAGSLPRTVFHLLLGILASAALSTGLGWKLGQNRRWSWRTISAVVSTVSLIPVYLVADPVRGGLVGADSGAGAAMFLLLYLVLAALLAVANGIYAESVQTVTNAVQRESGEPYVRSLVSRRIPVRRHILRSVLPVIVGLSSSNIPRMVTAVFILEWAFNLNGLGYRGIEAFSEERCDVPLILGLTLASVVVVRLLLMGQRALLIWLNPAMGEARD